MLKSFHMAAANLLVVLLLAAPIALHAQQSDPEALSLLRRINTHYSAFTTMEVELNIEFHDLESDQRENKKAIMAVKGDKFRIALDDQLVISDNQSIWVYLEEVNEIQITDYDPDSEDFKSPSELFRLPESDYFAVAVEPLSEEGKKLQVLELSPRNKDLEFHKVRLFVNASDQSLVRAVVQEKNGIHYTFQVEKFKANTGLSDDYFRIDPKDYPSAEIIDLRQ